MAFCQDYTDDNTADTTVSQWPQSVPLCTLLMGGHLAGSDLFISYTTQTRVFDSHCHKGERQKGPEIKRHLAPSAGMMKHTIRKDMECTADGLISLRAHHGPASDAITKYPRPGKSYRIECSRGEGTLTGWHWCLASLEHEQLGVSVCSFYSST